jgi:hypothetical protein
MRSTALYYHGVNAPRGFLDSKSRSSDRLGFSCPSDNFIRMLRDPQFEQQLLEPASKFVQEGLPVKRLERQRAFETAASRRRGVKRPRVVSIAAELGRQYRVQPPAAATAEASKSAATSLEPRHDDDDDDDDNDDHHIPQSQALRE